jgi:hypothetical protein
MWDDKQIDAAIDETARQMTAGEPGADFRVRVVARLYTRPRAMAMWRPALAVLSVAAMLVIGLVFLREQPRPQQIFLPQVRLAPDATAKPAEVKRDIPEVRLPPSPLGGFGVPRKPDATYDLEPLTTAPLDLDSIAVTALAASDSIDIEPLPLASPIAVTPLDVENEGDRR